MEADTQRMRGARPYVFTNLRQGVGADRVAAFIQEAGGLAGAVRSIAGATA
jgi:urease accessory protein